MTPDKIVFEGVTYVREGYVDPQPCIWWAFGQRPDGTWGAVLADEAERARRSVKRPA